MFMIFLTVSLFSSCQQGIDRNMSTAVNSFTYINQEGTPFGTSQLEDKWWIAYFVYTDCKLVCPTTTPNMVEVQHQLKYYNIPAYIVGFTVNPEVDTPEVLKQYAKDFGIDLENWIFLTGYEPEEIQELSRQTFQTVLEFGGPEEHSIAHSTAFFLVNSKGEVIKRYDGMSRSVAKEITDDLKGIHF